MQNPNLPDAKSGRIGIAGPFTGKREAYGRWLRSSALRVAGRYGLKESFFLFLDDLAEPAQAKAVADTMVASKVRSVVGHFNSQCARAVAGIYHHAHIPVILPASTGIDIPYLDCGYVTRYCPDNRQQCRTFVEELEEKKTGRVSVFCDETPYGRELLGILLGLLPGQIEAETWNRETGPQKPAEAALLLGTHFNCLDACLELRESGFRGLVLACDDCGIDEFLEPASGWFPDLKFAAPESDYGTLSEAAVETMVRACLFDEPRPAKSRDAKWLLTRLTHLEPAGNQHGAAVAAGTGQGGGK